MAIRGKAIATFTGKQWMSNAKSISMNKKQVLVHDWLKLVKPNEQEVGNKLKEKLVC